MRNILYIFSFLFPAVTFAQFPANPGKIRLGNQTTVQGIVPLVSAEPGWTPVDINNAWMALDTANNVLYYWDEAAGAWENLIDDFVRDTVYQVAAVADTSTLTPIQGDAFINASADTLGLYNGDYWVLFFGGGGGGSVEQADGLTILGTGTGGDPFRVDTTLLATRYYADSLFALADSLRADGDKSAPILVPVFDRNTQLDGCSTAETVYTGFLLIDDEAIDEGAITFEINASPATVTYDVYNADSTSYYFETSASRGAGVYFWEVSYTDADGNNVGDTNAFDVMAGTPDSVLTVVQDSILVLRVCGVEISRDTISTGGGSVEQADGLTILGAGTGGDPFRVDTTLLATRYYADSLRQVVYDSLGTVSLYANMPLNVNIPACDDNISVIISGIVHDPEIVMGSDITGDITVTGVAGMAITYIQEENGYAYFEATGFLADGAYAPDIEYVPAGLVIGGVFNVFAQPCYSDTLSNYPDRMELADSTAALRTDLAGDNLGNHTATQALNLNGNYLSGDGDSEGVFVDANGNVGIGLQAPEYPLHIQFDEAARLGVRIGDGNLDGGPHPAMLSINDSITTDLGLARGIHNETDYAARQSWNIMSAVSTNRFTGNTSYTQDGTAVYPFDVMGYVSQLESENVNITIPNVAAFLSQTPSGTGAGGEFQGAISNMYSFYSMDLVGGGSGNKYAFYTEEQTGGGTNYGYYSEDNNVHRLGGKLLVGNALNSSTYTLHTKGPAMFQNTGGAAGIRADRTDGKITAVLAGSTSSFFAFDETGFFAVQAFPRATIEGTSFGTPSMFVVSGIGDIGIGTNSPGYKIDARGAGTNRLSFDGVNNIVRLGTTTTTPVEIEASSGGVGSFQAKDMATGNFARFYAGGSANTPRGRIELSDGDASITDAAMFVTPGSSTNVPVAVEALTSNTTASDSTKRIALRATATETQIVSSMGAGNAGNRPLKVYPNGLTGNAAITVLPQYRVGVQVTSPAAALHLPAGTAAASTAPLKFTSGTNLTTPEAGSVEWDGTRLYLTQTTGPTRKTVAYTDDISASTITGSLSSGYIPYATGATTLANSGGYWDGSRLGIGNTSPQRTLHVTGEARITDLTTDTPTRIVGADADGDFGEMTAGTGISFAGGQVSATFDISDVGSNLSADDVPVWDGAAFQPSGIKSNGSTILLTADFPFLGDYTGAPGSTEDGYILTYDDAEGGIILKEGGIPRQFVGNVEVAMNEYTLLIGEAVGIAIDPTPGSETMTIGASPDSPGGPSPQITFDAVSNNVLVGMDFGMVFEAYNGIAGFARMGVRGGGTGPLSSHNVTVFEGGLIRVNSPDISFPSTEESTELGQVKVLVLEDSMLFYKDMILDKQSATYYEETERQYTLGTSPSADTVITVDTIGVAFAADSISIADGLITNDRSTTVTWMVHYDFTYNSDEDPCYSFFDLTTDGSEVPAAIAGSSAYSNQVSVLGTQHPGRRFLVNVPSGQAIRLCVKGNILAATEMNISYLTISIEEK